MIGGVPREPFATIGAPGAAASCSPSSSPWLDASTVCCLDLFLTVSSFPALSVSALSPHAPLHPRNRVRLDLPSPSPTSPWSLLRPSLRFPVTAAPGRTPPPLPGSTAARPRGDRYRHLSGAARAPILFLTETSAGRGWAKAGNGAALAEGTGTAQRCHLARGQQHAAGNCPCQGEEWAVSPWQPHRGHPVPTRSPAPTYSTHWVPPKLLQPRISPSAFLCPHLSHCPSVALLPLASSADGADPPKTPVWIWESLVIPWLWKGLCLQAACHPMAAEGSGSVPSQDRVSPGACFPLQPKLSFEQSKKEAQRAAPPGPPAEGLPQGRQEQEADKQAALNKGTAPGWWVPSRELPVPRWAPAPGPRGSAWCLGLLRSGHRPPQDQVSGGGGGDAGGWRGEEEHWRHGQRAGLSGRAGAAERGLYYSLLLLGTPGLFQHVPPPQEGAEHPHCRGLWHGVGAGV